MQTVEVGSATVGKPNQCLLPRMQDLSLLIPWGGNASGVSAFVRDTVDGEYRVSLSSEAMKWAAYDNDSALRAFTALDYRFERPIVHDTEAVIVTFDAHWDSASCKPDSAFLSVILMNTYPAQGLSTQCAFDMDADAFGTPALSIRIRPGHAHGTQSFLQYGGAAGGRFDRHETHWWLPGSVGTTIGSASPIPGSGEPYPLSSWIGTNRSAGPGRSRYAYRVLSDRQELGRNDTLLGSMPLPKVSPAPGYERFRQFEALRLSWRGLNQCTVSNFTVTVVPNAPFKNVPPSVVLTSPVDGTVLQRNGGVVLTAEAWDDDDDLDYVAFLINDKVVTVDSEAPFSYSWYPVPIGRYCMTAVAIDKKEAVSAGQVITIEVE